MILPISMGILIGIVVGFLILKIAEKAKGKKALQQNN